MKETIRIPLWNAMVLYAYTDDKSFKRKLMKAIEKAFEKVVEK